MSLILRKINAFAKKVANLPPKPGGTMPVADLQAQFDAAPEELRTALNGVIDDIVADYATKSELSGIQLGQITDGTITEPKLDSILAKKVNDALNAINVVDNLYRQAIINGNFDVWQRGKSWTNPVSGTYTADRWQTAFGLSSPPANITHSQQKINGGELPGSCLFYRLNVDGAGGAPTASDRYTISQRIENGTRYFCGAGKKVTVSFWARSSIAGKRIGIFLSQLYGSGGTSSAGENLVGTNFSLTASWKKYSFTFDTNTLAGKTFGTNNDDQLLLNFALQWGVNAWSTAVGSGTSESFVGTGNIDITQVQVNAGDLTLAHHPRSFAQELELCQRYYEKSYDQAVVPGSTNANGMLKTIFAIATGGSLFQNVAFKTRKRIAPTVTLYDGAGASGKVFKGADGKAAATDKVGESGFSGGTADTTNAQELAFHYTADAEF